MVLDSAVVEAFCRSHTQKWSQIILVWRFSQRMVEIGNKGMTLRVAIRCETHLWNPLGRYPSNDGIEILLYLAENVAHLFHVLSSDGRCAKVYFQQAASAQRHYEPTS